MKTPKEKKTIDTREKAEVKDFKATISEAFGAPVEQLCLIYAGKILKDHETLNTHGINDDKTVHLVIKTGQGSNRAAAEPSQPAAQEVAAQASAIHTHTSQELKRCESASAAARAATL